MGHALERVKLYVWVGQVMSCILVGSSCVFKGIGLPSSGLIIRIGPLVQVIFSGRSGRVVHSGWLGHAFDGARLSGKEANSFEGPNSNNRPPGKKGV